MQARVHTSPAALPLQAEHHAAVAAELGGEALVDKCSALQADVLNYQQVRVRACVHGVCMLPEPLARGGSLAARTQQGCPLLVPSKTHARHPTTARQALLDKEAELLEKDKQLTAAQARCAPPPPLPELLLLPRALCCRPGAPRIDELACVAATASADTRLCCPQAGLPGALCACVRVAGQVHPDGRPAAWLRVRAVPLAAGTRGRMRGR